MDYSQEYKQKLVSADEAVKLIKSGDWVDYGWCNGTVDVLDQALAKRTDELKNVNLRGGILLKPLAVFAREDAGEHFTWNSLPADVLTIIRSATPNCLVITVNPHVRTMLQ